MATIDFASSLIAAQFGRESTYGTSVSADQQFATLNIEVDPASNNTLYTSQGVLVPVSSVLGEEWSTATAKGPMDFNELAYIFSGILEQVASGTQLGASAAYSYTFNPSGTAHETTDSYTLELGDSAQGANNWKVVGAKWTDCNLKISRKAAEIDGKLIGQRYQTGITMTGSPTAITRQAVSPNSIDVLLATSMADLDYVAPLARAYTLDTTIGNRTMPVWPLRSSATSFSATTDGKVKADVKLLIGADSDSTALLTGMRAGTRYFLRIRAYGNTIATIVAPTPPAAPTLTPGTDGTLGAGVWTVGVALANAAGQETVPVTATATTVGSTGSIAVTAMVPPAGYTAVWYMGPAAGNTNILRKFANDGSGFTITSPPLTNAEAPNSVSMATVFPYTLKYDIPVEVASVMKLSDHDGVYAAEWNFTTVLDPVTPAWTRAYLINTVSALG